MIRMTVGRPGEGKSLLGCRTILDTLVNTERFVVTNIPMILSEVQAYVSQERERLEKAGIEFDEPFDIDRRLRLLHDELCFEFYRVRSGGLLLPESPDCKDGQEVESRERLDNRAFRAAMKAQFLKLLEDREYQRPVEYHIDEAHSFFDSREWVKTGRGLTFYASQHRHLHDEIFLYTQNPENVEKRLRGLCSETYRLRNGLRRRVGPVRLRPRFTIFSFYGCPAEGSQAKPYSTDHFELDPDRVAKCYKTVGALGVYSKPEEVKNKGLPWWSVFVGIGLLTCGIVAAFVVVPHLGAAAMKHTIGVVQEDMGGVSKLMPGHGSGAPTPVPVSAQESKASKAKEEPVEVCGVAWRGARLRVSLSNGLVLDENDFMPGDFVKGNVVQIGGVRYRMTKPKDRDLKPTPAAQVAAATPDKEPTAQVMGAWRRDPDGVDRLVDPPKLGELYDKNAK